MQITATLAATAVSTALLAGGVAGAALHAVTTTTVRVECPAVPPATVGGDDMRRFMERPAPPITGSRQF